MSSTCLVTGGAGFIGSHLTARLLQLGRGPVRILDNLSRARWSIEQLLEAGAEAVEGDVRDPSDLQRAMAGCDVVLHLAAMATVMACETDPAAAFAVNAGATYRLLNVAHEVGVKRVVLASSREVYGEPQRLPVDEDAPFEPKNAYGASKVAAEMSCRALAGNGVDVTVLRLSNVYGPGDTNRVIPNFIGAAKAGRPLTLYGGNQFVDFVWIDAVVDAFARAAFGPHIDGPVNIGSGIGTSILETARRVVDSCGSNSRIEVMPGRGCEVTRFVADVRRASAELGLVRPDDALHGLAKLASDVQLGNERPEIVRS
jgi:UDP-glucose 4-epimerase